MGGYGLGMGRVVHYSIEYIRSPHRDRREIPDSAGGATALFVGNVGA